jgi:probable rRNA maturation factor
MPTLRTTARVGAATDRNKGDSRERACTDLKTLMPSETDHPTLHATDEQNAVAVDLDRYVRLARLVLAREGVPNDVELSLLFVDEDTIARYNEQFLEHMGPTDVLAFPIDEDFGPGGRQPDTGGHGPGSVDATDDIPTLLGDVMVCPSFAAREAHSRGQSVESELSLLVVHGILHLVGYDHAEPDETERMQRQERALLAEFGAQEMHRE